MPLPTNTALTLSVARPTDSVSSGPKQAMLVRMTAETLDALEAFPGQPTLDFDFGDRSGIYIGESFFPMRHLPQEGALHELYLRTSQGNKKTPLKLHANIIGKITVERELQDDLREKIRETSNESQNQKNTRTTILIDNADLPQPLPPRKKPPANMFHNPTKVSSSVVKKPIPASSVDVRPKIRKQLVHYLATGDKTDTQMKSLFEKDSSTIKQAHLILDQISESTPLGQSGTRYTLKQPVWKEVRPYEYPLSEDERNSMARLARKMFHNLGVPESDPLWNHVRQRTPPAATSSSHTSHSSSHSNSHDEKFRSSKGDTPQPRTKPPAPKPPAKSDVPAKDESHRNLPPRPSPALDSRQSSSHDFASRRPASSLGDSISDRPTLHAKSSSISKVKSSAPPYPSKPSASTSSKASTSRQEEHSPPPLKLKGGGRDSPARIDDKERERSRASNPEKRFRDASPADRYSKDTKSVPKRKIPVSNDQQDDGYRSPDPKRRKVDQTPYPSSSSKRNPPPKKPDAPSRSQDSYRERDHTGSKNGDRDGMAQKLPKRLKEQKRSHSPLGNESSSSKLSKGKASSSGKSRQAPVFTSSEDEDDDDIRPPARASKRDPSPAFKRPAKREREPSPPPKRSVKREPSPPSKRSVKREPSPSPRPDDYTPQLQPPSMSNSDHASLRAQYEHSYGEYLECFQKLVAEKRKLNRLLKNEESRSIGSMTDSDLDLMDPEELNKLKDTHRKLHRELENIQNVFVGKA